MRGLWRIRQTFLDLQSSLRLLRARLSVWRFPRTARKEPSPLSVPLVVTLTSFPGRFATLAATLKSLLDQRMRADRTILWIAHEDRKKLPEDVTALASHGLEIRTCQDLRSYKKLIPALAEMPEACLVTADDDVYYPPDWLGNLVRCYDPASPAVIASRAHLAQFDADGFAHPYSSWRLATHLTAATAAGTAIFPTGVGGILYPPGCLHPDVMDADAFQSICPHGDDIWFFWMTRRNGFKHIRIPEQFTVVEWPSSQKFALHLENVDGGRNDSQIKALEAHYGPAIHKRNLKQHHHDLALE